MDPEDPEQQPNFTKKSKSQQKWEVFPGKNTFYCDGRLISGRNAEEYPWIFYLGVFLIILTFVMFIVFDGPYLAKHVSPILPVISAVVFVFLFANLLEAAFTDPGIIPRSTKQEAEILESEIEQYNKSSLEEKEFTRKVEIGGQVIHLQYCPTCKIIRPPRASHCRSCDNCVEMWDHHCPWIGNCVGRRNYRFYYWFLVLITIDTVLVFLCSLVHLYLLANEEAGITGNSFLDAVIQSPLSVLVMIICFVSTGFTFFLTWFHTILLAKSRTTRDNRKGSSNPYSRGNPFANCAVGLCAPRPPSLIDARGQVVSPDCETQNKSLYNTNNESVSTSKRESSPGSKNESKPGSMNVSSPRSQNESWSTVFLDAPGNESSTSSNISK